VDNIKAKTSGGQAGSINNVLLQAFHTFAHKKGSWVNGLRDD